MRKKKKNQGETLASTLVLALFIVIVPSVAIALGGLGIVLGILGAWMMRTTTKV